MLLRVECLCALKSQTLEALIPRVMVLEVIRFRKGHESGALTTGSVP